MDNMIECDKEMAVTRRFKDDSGISRDEYENHSTDTKGALWLMNIIKRDNTEYVRINFDNQQYTLTKEYGGSKFIRGSDIFTRSNMLQCFEIKGQMTGVGLNDIVMLIINKDLSYCIFTKDPNRVRYGQTYWNMRYEIKLTNGTLDSMVPVALPPDLYNW